MEPILVISSVLLWLVVLLNLFLTFALVRRVNASNDSSATNHSHVGLKKGEQAPDFKAQTLPGEPVTLATYTRNNRPIVLLIIGPDCGPCRENLPRYEALYPQARSAGTQLVLVSVGDVASTQALVEEFKITIPTIIAPQTENSFFTDYKLKGTPSYYLLDAQGKVQSAGYPNFSGGDWKELAESWETSQLREGRLATSERG